MRFVSTILMILILSACSSTGVQDFSKAMRGLTGGDVPRKTFLDPSVKEALEHEMNVCLDGKLDDVELRTKCVQIASEKVRAQKGLDKDLDLGGEVIVREVKDDEVIDGTDEQEKNDDQ